MENTYLIHHGIKGQRWGIRRFQNDDGTLTDAGKKRYSTGEAGQYESRKTQRLKKQISRHDADIASFEPFRKTGIRTKDGREVLAPSDIEREIQALTKVKDEAQAKLEKSQKRDIKKAESLDIRKNMGAGKKAAMYALGGAMGPTNYANYKAAGYSDKESTGKAIVDYWTGANLIGKSSRVRNRAADNS